jgi:hypothetical protein
MKPNPFVKDFGLQSCALCAQSLPLRSSHVIPRFVFEWMRDSSATGHIRLGEIPNRRVQDGWKPRLLCEVCEQRFSAWEKLFAEKIFVPLHSGQSDRFDYGPWLMKFAVSVSWRVLTAFKLIGGLDNFPAEAMLKTERALAWWSDFLLDRRPNPGPYEQHMLPVDLLEQVNWDGLPANFNRYLYRSIDMYVAHNGMEVITYAKMGRILLFGFVSMPHPRRWVGTKIHLRAGTLGSDTYQLPQSISTFLMQQAEKMQKQSRLMSPGQREVIAQAVEADLDRVANSEGFRAMQQDVAMFGHAAFESDLDQADGP